MTVGGAGEGTDYLKSQCLLSNNKTESGASGEAKVKQKDEG